MRVIDLCRKHGSSAGPFYKLRKNGCMDVSDSKRLHQLEKENSRLRKMVTDQALDISILKNVLSKTSEACRMPRDPTPCRDGMHGDSASYMHNNLVSAATGSSMRQHRIRMWRCSNTRGYR